MVFLFRVGNKLQEEVIIFGDFADFADTKHLGYICEARPSETVPEKRTCVFPFSHEGKIYSSCTFAVNPNSKTD